MASSASESFSSALSRAAERTRQASLVDLIESTDLDFVLKLCRKHRYMIQDHRFVCVKKSAHQEGGCNAQRTEADRLASRQYLLNTWGRYISYRPNRHGKINPQITVKYRH